MKKAFITGINGQDGSYLAEYLLDLGYEVHGIVRRNSTSENQSARLKTAYEKGQLTTHYGDLSDQGSLERLLEIIQPDEIYNIAGGFEQENIVTVEKIIKEYLGDVEYSSYIDTSVNRKGQDVRYALDDSKLRNLGWEPIKIFDQELPKIVEYYKNKFIW